MPYPMFGGDEAVIPIYSMADEGANVPAFLQAPAAVAPAAVAPAAVAPAAVAPAAVAPAPTFISTALQNARQAVAAPQAPARDPLEGTTTREWDPAQEEFKSVYHPYTSVDLAGLSPTSDSKTIALALKQAGDVAKVLDPMAGTLPVGSGDYGGDAYSYSQKQIKDSMDAAYKPVLSALGYTGEMPVGIAGTPIDIAKIYSELDKRGVSSMPIETVMQYASNGQNHLRPEDAAEALKRGETYQQAYERYKQEYYKPDIGLGLVLGVMGAALFAPGLFSGAGGGAGAGAGAAAEAATAGGAIGADAALTGSATLGGAGAVAPTATTIVGNTAAGLGAAGATNAALLTEAVGAGAGAGGLTTSLAAGGTSATTISQTVGKALANMVGITDLSPAVTKVIGDTAINVALNGGDVGKALEGAAIGWAAGGVGSMAQTMASNGGLSPTVAKAIGSAAANGTSAVLSGGDIGAGLVAGAAGSVVGGAVADNTKSPGLGALSNIITQAAITGTTPSPITVLGALNNMSSKIVEGEDPDLIPFDETESSKYGSEFADNTSNQTTLNDQTAVDTKAGEAPIVGTAPDAVTDPTTSNVGTTATLNNQTLPDTKAGEASVTYDMSGNPVITNTDALNASVKDSGLGLKPSAPNAVEPGDKSIYDIVGDPNTGVSQDTGTGLQGPDYGNPGTPGAVDYSLGGGTASQADPATGTGISAGTGSIGGNTGSELASLSTGVQYGMDGSPTSSLSTSTSGTETSPSSLSTGVDPAVLAGLGLGADATGGGTVGTSLSTSTGSELSTGVGTSLSTATGADLSTGTGSSLSTVTGGDGTGVTVIDGGGGAGNPGTGNGGNPSDTITGSLSTGLSTGDSTGVTVIDGNGSLSTSVSTGTTGGGTTGGGTTGGGTTGGGTTGGGIGGILGDTNNAQLLATLASLFSGNNSANAITSAMDKLIASITASEKTVKDYYDPYTNAGKTALDQYMTGIAPGGEYNRTFTMADAQNTPAMQFAQTQGQDIIQSGAAAKGGLLSSNTLAGLTKFGQANAAQYEQQAFNQWLANMQSNRAGVQTAMTQGANMASNASKNLTDLQVAGGKAAADGITGAANAQNQGIQNAISAYGALKGPGGSSLSTGVFNAGTGSMPTGTNASLSTGTNNTNSMTTITGGDNTSNGVTINPVTDPNTLVSTLGLNPVTNGVGLTTGNTTSTSTGQYPMEGIDPTLDNRVGGNIDINQYIRDN